MTTLANRWLHRPDGQVRVNENDAPLLHYWCPSCGDLVEGTVGVVWRQTGHILEGWISCPVHGLQFPMEILPPLPDEFILVAKRIVRNK